MNTSIRKGHQGFTVIEIMIALAVLAILLAFAAPTVENSGARSEMKQATDQMAQAFRTAKTAARINNSSVTVTLTTNTSDNTISFTFANGTSIADSGQSLPLVRLPAKVSVTSDPAEFTYDPLGMINNTGTIAIASTTNDAYSSTVVIDTLMGHVIAQYDDHSEEEGS